MRDQKTPLKESSRSSASLTTGKSTDAQPKKTLKTTTPKKRLSLGAEFSSTEGTPKKPTDLSSISEILDSNLDSEITSEITYDEGEFLLESCGSNKSNNPKVDSLRAKVFADLLTAPRAQVLKSIDVNHRLMKLLDRLIENKGCELFISPGNRTSRDQFSAFKIHVLLPSLLLWILTILVLLFFFSGSQTMYSGPLPT